MQAIAPKTVLVQLGPFHKLNNDLNPFIPILLLGSPGCFAGFEAVVAVAEPMKVDVRRKIVGRHFGTVAEWVTFTLNINLHWAATKHTAPIGSTSI